MHNNPTTIDEYIAQFPEEIQKLLRQFREVVRECAPEASEAIKYRMPTFVYHGNLVHFAAFKSHIGFFPTPSGIKPFEKELGSFVTTKGTIQFPLDKPIPWDLVRKIVKFRVAEDKNK